MLKKFAIFAVAALCSVGAMAAEVGSPAPEIMMKDVKGEEFKLSDHKGELVVLEWHNHKCPFVVKFYKPGKMQELQKTYTDKGVKWVRVISSAPGKQGHVTPQEAMDIAKESGVHATTTLLDEDGTVGKAFGAKTTPHMMVINKEGEIAYTGAIDSIPGVDAGTIADAEDYVASALDSLIAGEEIATKSTQPYGCGVKY